MPNSSEILLLVRILWDYHRREDPLEKVDLIFGLGSVDIRTAQRAADLYLNNYATKILFSGGVAHANDLLRTTWSEPEAVIFAKEAKKQGVPEQDILLEMEATNTGENITKSYELLKRKGIEVNKMILVQKPYMLRRTYATFMKQWTGNSIKIIVTSPQISFEEYFNVNETDQEKIINLMVGDLQRIIVYPQKGFQIYQEVPKEVLDAYNKLVELGYTKHLIKIS
jgi:uncharacterized SAM-binding protein YcdF (DUF218 family)